MEITVTVCNVCQEIGKPVTSYDVTKDGRTVTAAFCEEDGKFLAKLFVTPARTSLSVKSEPPAAAPRKAARTSARRRTQPGKVYSLDEIPKRLPPRQ